MSVKLDPREVAGILKMASAKLREQQEKIAQYEMKLAAFALYKKAERLADKMIDQGHLDSSDREAKIAQLMENPSKLEVINEALDIAASPNNFKLANLIEKDSSNAGFRQLLESYLHD